MERPGRIIVPAIIVVFCIISYFSYRMMTANNMDQLLSGDSPFGVHLVLQDSENKNIIQTAQMIVYPAEKHILFYFVNTDAAFSEEEGGPIALMSPGNANRFADYSEIKNSYYVYFDTNSLVRWIDMIEGVPYFIEEPIFYEKSDFQYPQGYNKFSGKQFVEFITSRLRAEQGKDYLTGVERVYRAESALLTLFWNRVKLNDRLPSSGMRSLAFSLFKTDMNPDEIGSLISYLVGKKGINASVMEVPLELQEKGTYYKPLNVLIVKDKRAKSIYRQFKEDLESGKFRSDTFSVEILNGTEISGLARKMQQYVQDRGPLVLDTNNYSYKPQNDTIVINRSGNVFNAEKLSELLELDNQYVFFRRLNLEVDVTLILGNNLDKKKFHY